MSQAVTETTVTETVAVETRQVRRARERHEAKVAASIAAGRAYPEAKHRPVQATGKSYSNGRNA